MGGFLKNVSLVGGFTLLSRLLGLGRDVLFFACFGSSVAGSAFVLAFTLPNLFRRMLGEGTLSSAFIPVFSDTVEKQSLPAGLSLLNKVLSRLSLLLVVILACGVGLAFCARSLDWVELPKWRLGLDLCAVTLPYVLFICLSAIVVGALNARRRFGPGAYSPILLNLVTIGTLAYAGLSRGMEGEDLALVLCVAVLLGGVLQLIAPVITLRCEGSWRPKFDLAGSPEVSRVSQLFVVGAFGAAVAQVNVLVSRVLGYSLPDDGAVSFLYLSSRLVELPLGLFAIAIATVVFPEMANLLAKDDKAGFRSAFVKGMRLTLAMTLPAAAGLAVLAEPILAGLFRWGRFGAGEVEAVAPILALAATGLPFYAAAGLYVRGFHARKDMKTPLRAALVSLAANVALSLSLMFTWGAAGLVAANSLAALVQTLYLWSRWRKAPDAVPSDQNVLSGEGIPRFHFSAILGATVLMTLVVWGGGHLFESLRPAEEAFGKAHAWICLAVLIPAGVTVHFLALGLFGFPEVAAVLRKLRPWVLGK